MKKIFLAFSSIVLLIACKQPASELIVTKAPVDSLIKNWGNSWNNHDSAAVKKLFATGALLIDDNLIADNDSKLSDKWIGPNINLVNNFKTSQLQVWSTGENAGYSGTYEFDVIVKDTVVDHPKGAFSLNWKKLADGNWKITTATIHSFTEKK